jgi:predicted esterase
MNISYIIPKHYDQVCILLHGMNQEPKELVDMCKNINNTIKFIIPEASRININWPEGIEENVRSWYNYYTRKDNIHEHDIIDQKHFDINTRNIINIIEKESGSISPDKITLSGISQGGTVAINSALKLKFKIKQVLCIDTIFLNSYFDYKLFSEAIRQDFKVFQSSNDKVYNPKFQDYTYNILIKRKYNLEKKAYILEHCQDINVIKKFIKTYL